MKKIYLIGGGGHCLSCIDVIEQQGHYKIAGIFDLPENLGSKVSGYEVIGSDNDIDSVISSDVEFLVTVGQIKNPDLRIKIYTRLTEKKAALATVISPRAYVSKKAKIGPGTIIMHDVLVNAGADIGNNCIVNSKALVEHGVSIGDHTHVSTAAVVNGDVKIGAESFIGSNAVIKQGITIQPRSFVNAGIFYRGSL